MHRMYVPIMDSHKQPTMIFILSRKSHSKDGKVKKGPLDAREKFIMYTLASHISICYQKLQNNRELAKKVTEYERVQHIVTELYKSKSPNPKVIVNKILIHATQHLTAD